MYLQTEVRGRAYNLTKQSSMSVNRWHQVTYEKCNLMSEVGKKVLIPTWTDNGEVPYPAPVLLLAGHASHNDTVGVARSG